MARLVVLLCVIPLLNCTNVPACANQQIEFGYLVDTSDTLQPGNKAAAQFSITGNRTMRLGSLSVMAYSGAATSTERMALGIQSPPCND